MTDSVGDVKRHTTAGVRSVLVLNLATIPLSFATNMVLGRISPDALGYYSAVQITVATYFTFCVLGGALVFTRFTQGMETRDRVPFLVTYVSMMLAVFAALAVVSPRLAPGLLERLLERIGNPSLAWALGVLFVAILWGFSVFFLYGVLKPAWAAMTEKGIVVGFFAAAIAGVAVWPNLVGTDPSRYLWQAALAIYGAAAALGMFLVSRTREFDSSAGIRWTLPSGFWSAAAYTHVSTIVNYVHQTLTPSLVLLWLDVAALGRLHAAFRYVVLLNFVPNAVALVLAPAVSRLDASGHRGEGLRQCAATLRTTLVLLGPAVMALILFCGDAMAVFGPGFRDHRRILGIAAISVLAGPVVHSGAGVAAALGAFRSYLMASTVYVVVAIGLMTALVPTFGLVGAASAVAAASFVRQTAVFVVLRRLGLAPVPRVWVTWAVATAAMGVQLGFDPSRGFAVLLWLGFLGVFWWAGRVTVAEVRIAVLRLLGRTA